MYILVLHLRYFIYIYIFEEMEEEFMGLFWCNISINKKSTLKIPYLLENVVKIL